MTFILNPHQEDSEYFSEYYLQRGCKITDTGIGIAVTVPSVCPYLLDNRCSVELIKPDLCVKYDCRTDPFLKGGNYYDGKEKKRQ